MVGGTRIDKSDVQLDAYGNIDELNAAVGMALEELRAATAAEGMLTAKEQMLDELTAILNQLFTIGGMLATQPEEWQKYWQNAPIDQWTTEMEHQIDTLSEELPAMKGFILPCGNKASAALHLARTICRRAERGICKLAAKNENERALYLPIQQYTNRLADFLFVMCRKALQIEEIDEIYWKSTK